MQLDFLGSENFHRLLAQLVEDIKAENAQEYARAKRRKDPNPYIIHWDFTELQYEFEDRLQRLLEKEIRAEKLDFEKAADEINAHSSKLFEGEQCS